MTIKEIAEMADVSIGTVDRALHHRSGVNKETEKKILEIVDKYGYQANPFARNLKLGKQYHLAILLPDFKSESMYWTLVSNGITKAEKELSSLSVTIDYYNFDRDSEKDFESKVEEMLASEPDGLLLAPVGEQQMKYLLNHKTLPPICMIDSAYPGFSPVSIIAQNPFRGGMIAGKMIHLLAGKNGSFLCVQVHPNAYNSSERAHGFHEEIKKWPGNTVFDEIVRDFGNLEEMLGRYPDILGVFITNSSTNMIGSCLQKMGRKDRTMVVGYDLVKKNKLGLEDGTIDCIISQRPSYQGYTGVYQLYKKVVLMQTPEENVEIPIDIFFRENLISTDE
ncbi:MAG: substrate-binding domain-containing protein [Spirochaetales bacterium]|nr:substrate-binding domain-containing protein [Spirochaetales bacterium]